MQVWVVLEYQRAKDVYTKSPLSRPRLYKSSFPKKVLSISKSNLSVYLLVRPDGRVTVLTRDVGVALIIGLLLELVTWSAMKVA